MNSKPSPKKANLLSSFIFASRWLQLPLYLGLILAQVVYVFHFWVELIHLIEAAFGSQDALRAIFQATGQPAENAPAHLSETTIMLVVLGLPSSTLHPSFLPISRGCCHMNQWFSVALSRSRVV